MPCERTVESEGQRIWTESLGSPTGPAVLLIGGAGAHAHFWSDSFCHSFIKNGYYVIRYDHRDVGLSHPSKDGYGLQQLVKDAVEILKAYAIPSAHIVGHSMGGYIGQMMAAEFPEHLLSLTVISAGPIGETSALETSQTAEERNILLATWQKMLQNRPTKNFEESFAGYLGVWERLNGTYPVDAALARKYTQEMYTRSRYEPGVHSKHIQVMEKVAAELKNNKGIFSKIHLPTLIIHGAEDYLVLPARGGQALAEALPAAKFLLIPSMGHMLFNYTLERLISEHIVSFLQENTDK